jgi:hypothetical protein
MSERIVSALAKMKELYVEQVRDNDPQHKVLEEKMQQVTDYKKNKLVPVGQETSLDITGDGKPDPSLVKRRIEITKAIANAEQGDDDSKQLEIIANLKKLFGHSSKIKGLKPPVNENIFYSWRDTVEESLLHEINDVSDNKIVKEKKVDNYAGKKPVVEINPEMKTESVLIDSEELDEDFIEESIDIATEYLCEEGLSDQDVQDLIDELGPEEFSEWVMQLGYETLLLYERKLRPGETSLPAKTRERITGKEVSRSSASQLKGGAAIAKQRADDARRQARATARQTPEPTERQKRLSTLLAKQKTTKSSRPPGQERLIKGARSAAQSATSPENIRSTVKGALDTVARGALSAAKGHQRAMEIKKKGGTLAQQLGGGAGAALGSFFKRGTTQFKEWVDNLLEEGYDLSEYTWDELYEEYELQEKAVSEQQQKLFGLALSVKRGETSRDKVSPEVLKILNTMSEAEIRKYASTPHEDVPEKKKELAERVIQFVRESR